MKKIISLALLSVVPLPLVACSNGTSQTSNSSEKTNQHSTNSISSNKSSSSSTHQKSNTKSKSSSAIWNDEKKQQLAEFMDSWGTEMKQTYVKRGPGNDTTSLDLHYPSDFAKNKTSYNLINSSAGWSDDGKGSNDINVVAIYEQPNSTSTDYNIYLFAIQNNRAIVYHTSQNQGVGDDLIHFDLTANSKLESGFAKIVGLPGFDNSESKYYIRSSEQAINLLKMNYVDGDDWTVQDSNAGKVSWKDVYFTLTNSDGETVTVHSNGDYDKQSDDTSDEDMDTSDTTGAKIESSSEALNFLIQKRGNTGWKLIHDDSTDTDKAWSFKDSTKRLAQVHENGLIQEDQGI